VARARKKNTPKPRKRGKAATATSETWGAPTWDAWEQGRHQVHVVKVSPSLAEQLAKRPIKLGTRLKQHSRPVRDVCVPVAKDLWPPHGRPSRGKISNKAALKLLNDELDRRFGKANRQSQTTSQLRAIGRRK